MLLRLSQFIHLIPLTPDRVLVVDAISHVRQVVDREVAGVIQSFATPREVPTPPTGSLLSSLLAYGILSDKSSEAEMTHVANLLRPFHGRDPAALLQEHRRKMMSGGDPYWAAAASLSAQDFQGEFRRIDVLLFGDCDMHMESDFLRREARRRGVDLRVAATFPDDVRLASEHKHDLILIGALRARETITDAPATGTQTYAAFLAAADTMLKELRQRSNAPILIDNLPEPTVQPLGMAERGMQGHRNRFRAANVALAEMVETHKDVHVVDFAAALAAAGTHRMIDDGYFGYTHFGSPGWLLQRAETEKKAVHGIFPDLTPLATQLEGDPYSREAVAARLHCDAISVALALDRKKCVILDLDGILWPGVLAETGAPFAWSPETSSPYSYAGLYFGIHEALHSLKKRGMLLASVSKNDEAVVRSLWAYDSHYPHALLLHPDDLVTWRINWSGKVDNILAIAEELELALESLIFIDDNPVERDRVRQRLPEVEVWGEDILGLRRRLLDDPRLQTAHLTAQSTERSELTKARLRRQAARSDAQSDDQFLASLDIRIDFRRVTDGADLSRVAELFERTTQFNTKGRKYSLATLAALAAASDSHVFAVWVKDRFGDHGLAGAAIVQADTIEIFALSCRVLGLGVEKEFLRQLVGALSQSQSRLVARIVPTARNNPVRNLYRDGGFALLPDGSWCLSLSGSLSSR